MNKKPEHISLWQLLALIITFEAGSSIVVGIGGQVKQDIWIATILACLLGVVLVYLFYLLLANRPGRDLFEIMEELFGVWLAKGLIGIYLLYFLYVTCIIVRDFVELISSTILIETPREVIAFTLVLLIVYILYLGLEVLARTNEIFVPYLIGSLILIFLLLFISESIQLKNIRPVLANGWGPIFHEVIPELLGFPFGEMVVFLLIMSKTNHPRHTGKISMFAVLLAGALLTFTNAIQVMALGAEMKARAHFPLMTAARSISIANFVERVDALVVFITMIGIVVKASVFLYGGVRGMERIIRVPYRSLVLPLGMIVSVFSILIGQSYAEYDSEVRRFLVPFVEMPVQVGIPLLILLLVLWKKWRKGSEQGGTTHENKT